MFSIARNVIRACLVLSVATGCTPAHPLQPPDETATSDWRITSLAQHREIEGFTAPKITFSPGEQISVSVSTLKDTTFSWRLFRVGAYGTLGAAEITSGGPIAASHQPDCPLDPVSGLVGCKWPLSFHVSTNALWKQGAYLFKLKTEGGHERYVPFVLSSGAQPADVLMVVPTATWAAYNDWGGASLYLDKTGSLRLGRAHGVSFDRPFTSGFGASDLIRWDRHVIRWLESSGASVRYATTQDLERDPALFRGVKAILISGHDEYWTAAIRTRMEEAVARGTSLLLFGANAGYWQTRLETSSDGREGAVLTCYKENALTNDPVGPQSPVLTTRFRDPPLSRPENALFGVMFLNGWNTYAAPVVVRRPVHWAFAGTQVARGDTVMGANGYEVDQVVNNLRTPPGLTVLAESPALGESGWPIVGNMVLREVNGAVVFAAGGTDFALTISTDGAPFGETLGTVLAPDASTLAHPITAQLAANVLARALGRAAPTVSQVAVDPGVVGSFAKSVVRFAGAAGVPGNDDGDRFSAKLHSPESIAVLPNGDLVIADVGVRKLKLIDGTGTVRSLPIANLALPIAVVASSSGDLYVADEDLNQILKVTLDPTGQRVTPLVIAGQARQHGSTDGPGSEAKFFWPTALALSPDERSLFVADTRNGSIRHIALDDPSFMVTTVVAHLSNPSAVAVSADGRVFAIEAGKFRVIEIVSGKAKTVAGEEVAGFRDGSAEHARFRPQFGLGVLPDGSLILSDTGNYRVRRIQASGVTTVAGTGRWGVQEGTGDQADVVLPTGLVIDRNGTVYVTESAHGTVLAITL